MPRRPKRNKPGPQDGLYLKIIGEDASVRPKKKGKSLGSDPLEISRYKNASAIWRRVNQHEKYAKIARWVRAIRKRMELSQTRFAKTVGVNSITIRRWERGYGYTPSKAAMKRLKELDDVSRRMKASGIKVEDN
jgi:DNA-binding transcriptional regulator YiaG